MAPLQSRHQRTLEMTKTLKDTPKVITDGKKISQVIRERRQLATSEGRDNMARVLKDNIVCISLKGYSLVEIKRGMASSIYKTAFFHQI